jgi:murein DD-endopeptidase MepM/ murein hydrolase activator NlpD
LLRKLLYKASLSILFLANTYLTAYAFTVQVQPEEVLPGDVFSLKINGNGSAAAEAVFLKENVKFHQAGDGVLIALVPVDISTPPRKYGITVIAGDEKKTADINIRPYTFRTIDLTVSEEKVTLSPEDQKRVEGEFILQKKIWDAETALAWNGPFARPTQTDTSTEFGVKRIFNKKRTSVHRGMDFRGKTGTPVKAINSGTVVLAEELFYGGNTLVVDHGMGLYSVYMHLSEFNAATGEKVSKEQVVGFVGSSGRVTGPHLHLSVKLNGKSVNPASLFKLEL